MSANQGNVLLDLVDLLKELQGIDNTRISMYELCSMYKTRSCGSSTSLNLISVIKSASEFDVSPSGSWVRFSKQKWKEFIDSDETGSLSPFEGRETPGYYQFLDAFEKDGIESGNLKDKVKFFNNFEQKMNVWGSSGKKKQGEEESEGEEEEDQPRLIYTKEKKKQHSYLGPEDFERIQLHYQHIGYRGIEDYDLHSNRVIYRLRKPEEERNFNQRHPTGATYGEGGLFPLKWYQEDISTKHLNFVERVQKKLQSDRSHVGCICSYAQFNIFGIEVLHGLGLQQREFLREQGEINTYIAICGYNRSTRKNEVRIVEIESGNQLECLSFGYSLQEYHPKTPIRYVEHSSGVKLYEKPVFNPAEFSVNLKHQTLEKTETLQYVKNMVYVPDEYNSLIISKDHQLLVIKFKWLEQEKEDGEKNIKMMYSIDVLGNCFFSNRASKNSENCVILMNVRKNNQQQQKKDDDEIETTTDPYLVFIGADGGSVAKIDLKEFEEKREVQVMFDITDQDDNEYTSLEMIMKGGSYCVDDDDDDSPDYNYIIMMCCRFGDTDILFLDIVNGHVFRKITSIMKNNQPPSSDGGIYLSSFYNPFSDTLLMGMSSGRIEYWNLSDSNYYCRSIADEKNDRFGRIEFMLDLKNEEGRLYNSNYNMDVLVGSSSNHIMIFRNDRLVYVKRRWSFNNNNRVTGLKWVDRNRKETYISCDYDGNVMTWKNQKLVMDEDENERFWYLKNNYIFCDDELQEDKKDDRIFKILMNVGLGGMKVFIELSLIFLL